MRSFAPRPAAAEAIPAIVPMVANVAPEIPAIKPAVPMAAPTPVAIKATEPKTIAAVLSTFAISRYARAMRNNALTIALLSSLAGCATSVGGIRQEPVVQTYESSHPPKEVALCLQRMMPGLDVDLGENYYSVSNRNQFGSILMNWLITPRGDGSTIELRKTNSIAAGMKRATECFN